jgi:hypothetical protein
MYANPKLTVLYKEMPWLKNIPITDKKYGDPGVIKVKRLDSSSITRWVGYIGTSDDFYWMRGYFFDQQGNLISRILPKKPVGIIARIKEFVKTYEQVTIENALARCASKDQVRYVVLCGHDCDDCSSQLYVYKMPEGITASELLRDIEEDRARWAAQKLESAALELDAELSEARQK